jgi:hypothetical protein
MKAIKLFSIAIAALMLAACEKTEWDVYTPNGAELYGNNSITDDNIITIAQLKQDYPNVFASTDQNKLVDKDIKIKGRVTGNDVRGNIYKQFMIQDETGAIIIAVNESGMSGYLAEGQEIVVSLKDLYVGGYRMQPEIGSPYNVNSIGRMQKDVFQKHFKFVNSAIQPVQPIAFDIDMDKNEHCAKLVTLKNVTFSDANGTNTFAPGDGSAQIVGGCVNRGLTGISTSKLVIRTSTYAKFAANKLPYDEVNKKPHVVNITGIATRYNNTWQILIRKESDIEIVQ